MNRLCRGEYFENSLAEGGKIVRATAAHEMSIDNDRGILKQSTRVDEIIFDPWRTGDADIAINVGGNRDPAPMANRRDEFS